MIGLLFYKLGAFFAGRLPQKLSESITELILKAQYAFRIGSRRVVKRNLEIVLGDGVDAVTLAAIRRRVFSYFAKSIYYFLRIPYLDKDELKSRCNYDGIDKLAENLMRDGGFLVVGPHVGPWEVGGACLAALGVGLHTVAMPHPSPYVTRFFEERRQMLGIQCIAMGKSVETLSHALRQGDAVALLVDRAYGRRKRLCRLFGRDVELPIGHVALAVRCRVPIVTTVCVFEGGGVRFVYNGPHYPNAKLGHDAAMNELQEKCIRDMETYIRAYPDQWFHFHPFGK